MLEWLRKTANYSDALLAFGVICILLVLLFPVPTFVLDILLAFSITVSIVILMSTLFINKPLELSIFPTILLITTLMRLSLNIASTRLILSRGHLGSAAAGHIIEAFGDFVMQGNVVIGIIVFMILTIINFIVITKGSGRIAEVAARFSLDAMPGKQMAIDADLAAGLVNESDARARRRALEDESAFYGAMDGANKFVRGDAVAGIIITFINLIGGMIIGIIQKDLTFDMAVETYTILTVGDGLVAQIPSLVISLAAGLLVTKSSGNTGNEEMIFGQLGKYPHAIMMSGVVIGVMSLLPGLPFMPFMILALCCGVVSYYMTENLTAINIKEQAVKKSEATKDVSGNDSPKTDLDHSKQIDKIRIELGFDLLTLVSGGGSGGLVAQIRVLRNQMFKEYGFLIPVVRIRDNFTLAKNQYSLMIKEVVVGSYNLYAKKLVAVVNENVNVLDLPGEDTIEPAYGLNAKWIDAANYNLARSSGYLILDPTTILITHLTNVIRDNITDLLSYSDVQIMLDDLDENYKKLVKELVPDLISVVEIQKILHRLLFESVSIRDITTILEAISECIKASKDTTNIAEFVRRRLSRQICSTYKDDSGYLNAIVFSQQWESLINSSMATDKNGDYTLNFAPSTLESFIKDIFTKFQKASEDSKKVVLLTSALARPYVSNIVCRLSGMRSIPIMSNLEVHRSVKLRSVGII